MKRFDLLGIAAMITVIAACGTDSTKGGSTDAGGGSDGNVAANDGGGSGDGTAPTDADLGEGGFGPDGAVSVSCTAYGGACTFGGSCCSGVCDTTSGTCASSISTCAPATAACVGNTDCCSGSCVSGHCGDSQCLTIGAACPVAGNTCCSGDCTNGTCQSINAGACVTANNACNANGDCCSGLCGGNGRCVLGASYCIQTNDICYHADDCCGGICTTADKQPISATNPGICSQPTSGSVNCTGVDGSLCAGGACGSCCSRLCAPYGPTGVNICQPAQGCRVEGDLCRSNSDCCGAAGSGVLGDGSVVCSNSVNGGTVGVCMTPGPTSAGGTCVPEGDVCHYTASNYACGVSSARSDCCGPQTPKFTACALDPLGVPRCNAYTGVNGDGGVGCIASGNSCSTASDCCNGSPCVPGPTGALQCSATSCQSSGQTCTANADCCSGLPCVTLPGSIRGTCTPVTPPPGTSTGDAGTPTSDAGPSDASPPDSGYSPEGGYSCALFGQSCATLPCCAGTTCAAGFCESIPR